MVTVRYIGGLDGVYVPVGPNPHDDFDDQEFLFVERGGTIEVPDHIAHGAPAGTDPFSGLPAGARCGLLAQVDQWEPVESDRKPRTKPANTTEDGEA